MNTETLSPEPPPAAPPRLSLEPLTATGVNVIWRQLEPAIKASLPPTEVSDDPGAMNNVLAAVMKGELQVWVATKQSKGACHVYGGIVTQVINMRISAKRRLWIFSLFMHETPPPALVGVIVETLREYARKEQCSEIVAMTDSEAVIKLVGKLKGDSDYRLVRLEVQNGRRMGWHNDSNAS